ncbi:MAG: glycine oxidase ThiO [Abditibacteriales bacterium]|nr:glycine oxidase ThiO [Abditibacteriales bacterium]
MPTCQRANDVIVIGGGAIGLSIGWYLARAGCPVTVLERGEAGRAATWAAAGMLTPHIEAKPTERDYVRLLRFSHDLWVDFAHALEEASGVSIGYRTEGTLMVALDRDDAEQLKFRHNYMQQWGLPVEWISGYEARQREPLLSRHVVGGLFSPLDHQVDNRAMVLALREALVRAGGNLREHTEVRHILIEDNGVRGVKLDDETIATDAVVLCAGAWSRNLNGLPESARPPVRPVKGQILTLQMPPDAPLITHVVWGLEVYLVPRHNGQLIVGATVEEMGFDTQLTAGGILSLLDKAWEVLPGIYDLPLVEMTAGLRPGSRDDAPILGETSVRGLFMATGHYRKGILLAPVTALTISHLILTGETMDIIKPFNLARFR